MARAMLILNSDDVRAKAVHWIQKAPVNTRIEFKSSKRTLPQNDRMWAMLSDVAQQGALGGKKFNTDEWKAIFLNALGREARFLPAIDERGVVPYGQSSSDLSVDEMSDLMELVTAWGAEHGVIFHDKKQESVATSSQATDAQAECEDSPPSVDSSASAAGDSGSPPPATTSPAEIPADENKRLIDFARDMFSNLSAGNAKMIETNWMPEIKGFSEPAKSAAREVSKSVRAILNDGHDAEYALAYFAEALGCEAGDLKNV